jgi:cytochrome b subunit of formate dehydrogenase
MGSASAANCGSCHGYHGVFPSSDPRSTVHPSNMVATCARCHPGANENFAQGRIHMDDKTLTDTGSKAIHWVRVMYIGLIFGTIGGMLLHNLLAFRRHLLKSLRDPSRNVMRMGRFERWLHGLLMLSFTYLAISGFALRFPGSWLTLAVGSSETIRRLGHRIAAVVLMSIALAYFIHVVFTKEGRQMVIDMLPRRHDLSHFIENIRHYLHLEAARPKFTRYWYAEKAEYWALIWGTIIMGLTGSLIWFKMFFTHWLPRWVIEVSIAIHFYEAVLACLAIFVWHFYFVIFDPEIYPMNWAWLDGKVTDDHHAAHLHKAEAAEEDEEGEPPPED